METFSGHHMKICSINHCCPVKQKSNHRWGHALSKFLMHGNYEAGCVPAQGNQTCHIPRGVCARTGRSLLGKLLAGGTGDAHTACTGAQHFQCTSSADLENTVHWSEPENQCIALGCLLCRSHWPGVNRGDMSNSLPDSLVPAWPPLPKGGRCFPVSTDSDISPLMHI